MLKELSIPKRSQPWVQELECASNFNVDNNLNIYGKPRRRGPRTWMEHSASRKAKQDFAKQAG